MSFGCVDELNPEKLLFIFFSFYRRQLYWFIHSTGKDGNSADCDDVCGDAPTGMVGDQTLTASISRGKGAIEFDIRRS